MEEAIMTCIEDATKDRMDVARFYARIQHVSIQSTTPVAAPSGVDIIRVNQAITARWSVLALKWIKDRAIEIVEDSGDPCGYCRERKE